MTLLFWVAMMWVLWLAWPEWVMWWKVYQWKRQMRKELDSEWSTRQRSGSDEPPAG